MQTFVSMHYDIRWIWATWYTYTWAIWLQCTWIILVSSALSTKSASCDHWNTRLRSFYRCVLAVPRWLWTVMRQMSSAYWYTHVFMTLYHLHEPCAVPSVSLDLFLRDSPILTLYVWFLGNFYTSLVIYLVKYETFSSQCIKYLTIINKY